MANGKKQTGNNETIALAKPLDVEYMALANPQAFEALQITLAETLGDDLAPFDFDELKIPSGGALSWNIPDIEGTRTAETVQGVLIYVQAAREYYATAFTGESQPPTCFSPDNKLGYGVPGGPCKECPFSKFGSGVNAAGQPTKSQACSERKHLLFLPEDSLIPWFINLPPTSTPNLSKYCLRLGGKGIVWSGVVTEIGLEQDKSNSGITYSKATFRMVGLLTPEQQAMARQYVAAFDKLIRPRMIDDAKRRVDEGAPEAAPAETSE